MEALTEIEETRFMGCEAVVSMGWHTFVEVGLAFAQIRDERLHRVQFANFEAYCQAKWHYGRNYVNRLISAAQVFKHLVTISHLKPDHETQIRPLIGLTPDKAQTAWEKAVEKAGGRKITARLAW